MGRDKKDERGEQRFTKWIYRDQGARTAGPKALAKAVTAYHAALRVFTEADHPLDWAMTQQNLANALQTQGQRTAGPEGAYLLADAVAAYRAALRVRTEADHPVHWAMTQENLAMTEEAIADHDTTADPRRQTPCLSGACQKYMDRATLPRTRPERPWQRAGRATSICCRSGTPRLVPPARSTF